MKKIISIIAVFIGLNTYSQEINFGAKAGVNFASIAGDDADGLNNRTSFHVGFLAEIPLAPKFSLQPEIQYSAQGATAKGRVFTTEGTFSYEAKIKLDYINLPVMANYSITDKFSLQAGPQIGFLVSAKAEAEVSDGMETGSAAESTKDDFKAVDFGIGFGAEYEFANGLFLNARYVLGLTNILKPIDITSITDQGNDPTLTADGKSYQPKSHNTLIQLSVGYMF
ncbi:MAG TPA: porin family protein [Flavobacteriaceae bacterium]|nr:porin family protein [Flavobacteriaceae bacterium]